ncbi:MAG TPA: hypothetical protein VH593_14390 [Ktedonobacteraceae bacterium]
MRKKTIIILYILAISFSALAIINFEVTPLLVDLFLQCVPHEFGVQLSSSCRSEIETIFVVVSVISIVLLVIMTVLGMIAWIGALVKQGQQQQWGWFVCTLLFGGLVLFIYLIAIPESLPQLPVPGSGQVYQPPMYYPPNQPFYPSSPNDPRHRR